MCRQVRLEHSSKSTLDLLRPPLSLKIKRLGSTKGRHTKDTALDTA